jgi:hypothetical protein
MVSSKTHALPEPLAGFVADRKYQFSDDQRRCDEVNVADADMRWNRGPGFNRENIAAEFVRPLGCGTCSAPRHGIGAALRIDIDSPPSLNRWNALSGASC